MLLKKVIDPEEDADIRKSVPVLSQCQWNNSRLVLLIVKTHLTL